MIKQINKLLKLVGFNLVRAKRKAPKSEKQRVKETVAEFIGKDKSEWQNIPDNPTVVASGKTHFVGDNCPGGHREEFVSGFIVGIENVCIGDPTYDLPDVKQPNPANEPK